MIGQTLLQRPRSVVVLIDVFSADRAERAKTRSHPRHARRAHFRGEFGIDPFAGRCLYLRGHLSSFRQRDAYFAPVFGIGPAVVTGARRAQALVNTGVIPSQIKVTARVIARWRFVPGAIPK